MSADVTHLSAEETGGLGPLEIHHPPGTFALTPASLIAVESIATHQHLLHGRGLDWGSGSGVLAITAARISGVTSVLGLELNPENVGIARENASRNDVQDKVAFYESDSYEPLAPEGQAALAALEGDVDFILANPPSSSPKDDGFGFRREVIRGAGRYLKSGGHIFLSVSFQYGMERVMALLELDRTLRYEGVLASTEWVPFDCSRPDLLQDLETYAAEEARGGYDYSFRHPDDPDAVLTATEGVAYFRESGESPLSRWQSHLLTRVPSNRF